MSEFCHLHLHTEYSLLDGNTKIIEVPEIVKGLGQSVAAVTDHGSMAGSLKFAQSCVEHEVKPILGVEGYVTPDLTVKQKDSPTWHIVMVAMNEVGKHNLFRLSQIGWTQGFYRKPRIDWKALKDHNEGIIATSACMAGELARAMETSPSPDYNSFPTWEITPEAVEVLERYVSIFGDRFYIELQPGNPQVLNDLLSTLAATYGLKTVVTVDSHYSHCSSKAEEELLLIMQQVSGMKASDKEYASLMFDEAKRANNLLDRLNMLWPNRSLRFDHHDLYIMGRDEVVERMNAQGFDGNALADTTLEIAERCEPLKFKTGEVILPNVGGNDPDNLLKKLVREGLEGKGLFDDPVYRDRAKEELAVLKDKGFSNYFLIVADLIAEARRRNIYVGPGRGSAAGSLVAYALDIVAIDPIVDDLLFFRFINAERNDFPDIDMDFEHTRRDEMKEYFMEKYGEALSLSTFGAFQARGMFRDICRVLCIPLDEVNKVAKTFNSVKEYAESTKDATKSFRNRNPEILPIMEKFTGQIKGNGMHAAGVVIADRPMYQIVPIESRPHPDNPKESRIPVTAFDMIDAEKVGLIKFDFLGLQNLSVIHDCVDIIKERHGVEIDWQHIPRDDKGVLEMLGGGHTIGVFQMESGQYRRLLIEMGVDTFEDLVASNALVRPGAYETVAQDYINRKHGREEVTYPHPSVTEELQRTYGTYIYQEQVMQMAVKLGGFSWGEADRLRKIIGKKKDASEFQPFYEKWIKNAGELIGEQQADKIWKDFEHHSGYSFNRSHAVAYTYVGWVTAWLKYHYPTEYMYSILKNETVDTKKMTYLLEAKRLGIAIHPPCAERSEKFTSMTDDGGIRFGLTDIFKVGYAAADEIIQKRPFVDWDDFNDKVSKRKCSAKVVESLVAVDALRVIDGAPYNSDAEANYQKYLNYPIKLEDVHTLGINPLNLEDYDDEEQPFAIVVGVTKNIKRDPKWIRLELEDMTGSVTVFGKMDNDLSNNELVVALIGDKTMHGYARIDGLKERTENGKLDGFEKILLGDPWGDAVRLRNYGYGGFDSSKILAMPINIRRITTKTGKRMASVYFYDGELIEKVMMFPQTWEQTEKLFSEFKPVCIKVDSLDDGGYKLAWNGAANALDVLRKKEGR